MQVRLVTRIRRQGRVSEMGGGRVRSPERTVKIARAELTTSLFVYRRLLGNVAAYAILDSLMRIERHVKLFKNGRNQTVRIRREFELPGEDAVIRKEGERLIIEPAPPKSLLAVLATYRRSRRNFRQSKDFRQSP